LPNPPRIVEGALDIGFVEMLDGMGAGTADSLHASVRIYDNFAAEDLDEFVGIVEDGFLPLMRETDGFFGYYLMNDGMGTLGAVSLFDSEASALASNEHAREFVAENLTAYLPSSPMIVSGGVSIASFAEINGGANLIAQDSDEGDFASLRIYDGIDPADQDEIVRLVEEGFLPIVQGSDGFVAYYLVPADDMLVAISLFETAAQATASTEAARGFVSENLAPLLPNAPMVVEGQIDVSTQMMIDFFGEWTEDMELPLFAALRIYNSYDMTHLDEANRLVESILLPAQMDSGDMFAYFSMNDGVDTVVGFSVFVSEDGAAASNDIAADFVAEHLADFLPDDPIRINGRMGVAVREGVLAGVNAANWDRAE
jgi:hypothetical protein